MRDQIRAFIPKELLNWYRQFKKNKVRLNLEKQKNKGDALSQEKLVEQFKNIGNGF